MRVKHEILRPRDTRLALIEALTDLTGRAPVVFEPRNAYDTGTYATPSNYAYGVVGGYGNMTLPWQMFIHAFLPVTSAKGVGNVAGYGVPIGSYRSGTVGTKIEYITPAQIVQLISAQDINNTIVATLPAGTVGWTAITG